MVGEARALREAGRVVGDYEQLLRDNGALQKTLERFYLHHEAHIRRRVALLDEMQASIADERKCLEVQHQECRVQISAARRNNLMLQTEGSKASRVFKRSHATIDREEAAVDERIAEVTERIRREDDRMQSVLEQKEQLEKEVEELGARESHKRQEEKELERALREIKNLSSEITQRKSSLEKKNSTIAEWNRTLEQREKELVRCQDQLRQDLRQLEQDEGRFGVKHSGTSLIIPIISQRSVMDDHDMSIERENDREEIDMDDEYSDEHINAS